MKFAALSIALARPGAILSKGLLKKNHQNFQKYTRKNLLILSKMCLIIYNP